MPADLESVKLGLVASYYVSAGLMHVGGMNSHGSCFCRWKPSSCNLLAGVLCYVVVIEIEGYWPTVFVLLLLSNCFK